MELRFGHFLAPMFLPVPTVRSLPASLLSWGQGMSGEGMLVPFIPGGGAQAAPPDKGAALTPTKLPVIGPSSS